MSISEPSSHIGSAGVDVGVVDPPADRPARDPEPHLAQVAFSVVDLAVTKRWFRDGLGFQAAGGARWRMRGRLASAVQGLPHVASTCSWLVGRNEFFQLELFEFERPIAKLAAHDAQPSDIGYRRIGVWVADFDQTVTQLTNLGSPPLASSTGPSGQRRACVRNPDGVYVEIMERDPLSGAGLAPSRSECPVAVRSVILSVPDLTRSATFFQGLGLPVAHAYAPEREALWSLDGARSRGTVLRAGGVLVEIVEYLDPAGRARPAGYRICDQGILNIAFGERSNRDHLALYQRARAAGARPSHAPVRLPGGGVVYVNDADDFSVELLWMSPRQERFWGFAARPERRRPDRASHAVEQTVRLAAPIATTWDVITNHDAMGNWLPLCSVHRVLDGAVDRDGRGSERQLTFPGAKFTEQVVDCEPPTTYRYRVTRGSPFVGHHGEIHLREIGDQTELRWAIRFRPKVPGTGRLLALGLSALLGRALRSGLKPYVEQRAQLAPCPPPHQGEKDRF